MPADNDNGDGANGTNPEACAIARRMRARFRELRAARGVVPESLRDVFAGTRFATEPAEDTSPKPEPV
jgi:hypothetical protein